MIEIKVTKEQNFSLNSNGFPVSEGRTYKAVTEAAGESGREFSAYFSIIFLNEMGKEIARKIRWLNDFSRRTVEYILIATAPKHAKTAILAYRINTEGSLRSDCTFKIKDIHEIPISETEEEEKYEKLDDYVRLRNFRVEITPLCKDEEDDLEERMVWVFGSPRSGSSWLVKELLARPEHIIWDEPWIGLHLGLRSFGDSIFEEDVTFSRLFEDAGNSTQYFFQRIYEDVWLHGLRSMILNRCYAQFPDALNKTVIIKEPGGTRGADIILKSLPTSKMLSLIRDPRDVIDSKIDMHRKDSWVGESWKKGFKEITHAERKHMIIFYSRQWLAIIDILLRAYHNHDPQRRMMIKYENLREHPFKELKKIYEFIGTPITDQELKKIIEIFSFENIPKEDKGPGKFTRQAKPGGWKESFTDDEKEIMNSILWNRLEELGYEA